jgi:putative tricarboxylic transport membrane protein
MDEKQMAKADFITSIVMILAGVVILAVTLYFPRFPEWGGIYSNPGFTPFLLVLSLIGMYLYLLVRSLRRGGNQVRLTGKMVKGFFQATLVKRYFLCLGLFFLYYLLLGHIPFIVDTSLFLFLSILIFGGGGWLKALTISVATSFAVYLIFLRIFLVPLP